MLVRNDGDNHLLLCCSAENDLRSEPSAEAAVEWQRLVDQSFEYTALTRRLVTDNDNLR
jgi:hypothetical protein